MKVPSEFFVNKINEKGKQIYLKRYVEHIPTKIYTQVNENLLVIVLKGKKHLVYQEFEATVHEGEFAFFKKGNYIMNQIITYDEYESLLIFLSDDLLRSIPKIKMVKETKERPFFIGNTIPYMKQEVTSIMELMEEQEDYDEIIKLKIVELLMYIQGQDKTGAFQSLIQSFSMENDFRINVLQYYDQCHSITEMADIMHMSISTFKRRFQENFSCTPHSWMNEENLKKAEILLRSADYSVTDVSFICGFESLSTFMMLFKKKYGISPGKYRSKMLCLH